MRVTLAAIIMALSLPAGTASAGTIHDSCIAEEKALRAEASDRCSGLSYLFNPSGCFIAEKALKTFEGKCRPMKTEAEPQQSMGEAVPTSGSDSGQEKAPHEALVPELNMEQLKAENTRLKAEIVRLKAEMEQLRR